MYMLVRGFKTPLLILIALGLVGALSCSRAQPEIAFGSLRLVYFQGSEGPEERFSFFVLPDDEDGIEDLAELYLYHDREGLSWQLNSDDWVTFQSEGQEWIGSRAIAMIDGESLPRGQFRAVLVDKGGEQTERLFAFDAPAEPRHPFPYLYIEGDTYRIESEYPEHYFSCYNNQGDYLQTVKIEYTTGYLQDAGLPQETAALALWDEDSEYYTSALSNVAALR
jgi:hypothetical protein